VAGFLLKSFPLMFHIPPAVSYWLTANFLSAFLPQKHHCQFQGGFGSPIFKISSIFIKFLRFLIFDDFEENG